jgi:hypothetical protein
MSEIGSSALKLAVPLRAASLQLAIFGAWIPGFILFNEIVCLLYFTLDTERQEKLAAKLFDPLSFSLVAILAIPFVIAISLGMGYGARTFIFAISNRITARRRAGLHFSRIVGDLSITYGEEAVKRAFAQYPFLYTEKAGSVGPIEVNASDVFAFFKYWLRSKAPSIAVDYLEFEINLTLGLVIPMMLLSFILGFGWLKFFYSYGIWIDVASILNAVEQLCLIPIPLLTGYYLYRKGNVTLDNTTD